MFSFEFLSIALFGLVVINVLYESVGGIMVSIAAFQAVDPGSIPGRRKTFFYFVKKRETGQ